VSLNLRSRDFAVMPIDPKEKPFILAIVDSAGQTRAPTDMQGNFCVDGTFVPGRLAIPLR
jgi:hypothetical protein